MTDAHSANGNSPLQGTIPARAPFPVTRMLYAVGFAVAAWVVFWLVLVLAVAQFIVLLVTGRCNDELKGFTSNLLRYLWDLLAFITFVRDDQPFPIGPFPRTS